MTCEEVRIALGAHALGALEPDEALEVDTHLAGCEACGAELVELQGVSAFLEKVSERDVQLVTSPPRQVLDRLLNARVKRRRRGRMLMVVAASAAAIVAGGGVWTAAVNQPDMTTSSAPAASRPEEGASKARDAAPSASTAPRAKATEGPRAKARDDQPRVLAETRQDASGSPKPDRRSAAEQEFSGQNGYTDAYASVAAFPGTHGTGISVRVSGVPTGTTCRLVVVGRDGRRDVTDSWTVNRASYQGKPAFAGQTRISMGDIARFDVVDVSSNRVLVTVEVPR
ncbi:MULTISPECIES: zf-HC2 domain-containing protein [unclassified Nonomuraea]|uniref:anti-sigma factor family protein n=1 Tax=unclassified Nonomuraea TaxID=2593643 RepID=UPI0033EF7245